MKFDRSNLLILLYCVFVLLFAFYAAHHFRFGVHKGGDWWYFIRFLLVGGYSFYVLQGLILRSKNWGVLLILPLAVLVVATIVFYGMVGIIRWGGGDLLDRDGPDIVLATLLYAGGAIYGLRFIRKGKGKK